MILCSISLVLFTYKLLTYIKQLKSFKKSLALLLSFFKHLISHKNHWSQMLVRKHNACSRQVNNFIQMRNKGLYTKPIRAI